MRSKEAEKSESLTASMYAMQLQERTAYPPCGDYLAKYVTSPAAAAARCAKAQLDEEPMMRRDPSSIAIHTLDGSRSARVVAVIHQQTNNYVDMECRSKMCEWFYQVIDYCGLSRDTVQICMSYLDTFLATCPDPYLYDRERYQLAAITSLYLSIKLHEPVELDVKLLAVLSRGTYSQRSIVEMEQIILTTLKWRLNPPIPNWFVSCYMALLKDNGCAITVELRTVNILATFQTELGTVDYTMRCSDDDFSSHEIALASVLNAVEAVQNLPGLNRFAATLYLNGLRADCNQVATERISSLRKHLMQVFALSRRKSLQEEGSIVLCELKSR